MIPGGVDAWMWMVLIRILVSIRNSLLASFLPSRVHVSDAEVHPFFGLFRAMSSALHLQ
jgi:hypothetical protein